MTVEVLRLSGLPDGEPDRAVSALLADFHAHPDLSRLLVVDNTVALIGHSVVFERLLTSHRLDHLVCVAVGPRAADSREFRFPGNIGGGQGSTVLWVSDPHGIDWRLAASAIARGHSGNSASGLDHLIELLMVDEVFDRVCDMARQVPGGVASPGIRLAGTDDEAGSFAAALVLAIRRLTATDPGLPAGADEPFTVLQGAPVGTARLTEQGELARYREEATAAADSASRALTRLAGIGGLLGLSPPSIRVHVTEAGSALGAFRNRTARLLGDAHALGGLTDKQRGQLAAAGVQLLNPPSAGAAHGTGGGPPGTSAVYGAIAEAVRVGETLPQVARRLNVTANALAHGGSGSRLRDVDRVCPLALVRQLADPPAPPRPRRWWLAAAGAFAAVLGVLAASWSTPAGVAVGAIALVVMAAAVQWSWRARVRAWRAELALDEAVSSADALADLVITVAAREWSGANATVDEITRARIVLDGVTRQLTEHADASSDVESRARALRAARLSEGLTLGLRDLVLMVLAAGSSAAGAAGQTAFDQARAKTAELVSNWTKHAREHGALARPPFATYTANSVPYADEGEITEIAEAVQHDPREVMWQLCTPADLSALDMAGALPTVAFAPRLTRQQLVDVLPQDTIWTSSGAHAGLLRLVPLRPGIASTSWAAGEQHREPR
jgi:hypothetical protein